MSLIHRPALDRTTAKTASYAVMHLTVAIAVAFVLTRSWRLALAIGLIEPAVQTIAYYIHERAWNRRARRDKKAREAPG